MHLSLTTTSLQLFSNIDYTNFQRSRGLCYLVKTISVEQFESPIFYSDFQILYYLSQKCSGVPLVSCIEITDVNLQ